MFLSSRRTVSNLFTAIIFIILVLVFSFPEHVWTVPDEPTPPNPAPLPQTKPPTPEIIPANIVAPKIVVPETVITEAVVPQTTIPEKIWYKLGPRGITQQAQKWIDSCLDKNPTYTSEFMTDLSGDAYVKEKFAHRPDIVKAFLALPFPILKADFLRYLLLFNEGGIYSDLDVSCGDIPMRDWIPTQYKKDVNVVIGWELDVGWKEGFMRQFATWTIMARPGSPHILMIVDDILEGLRQKTKEHNVTIADLTWTMVGDVVDLTGPRRMTSSILKSLKATLGDKFNDESIAPSAAPKLVGDVLILPGYSFAFSSNHYKPEETQGPILVTHHFDGSWKNDHGGQVVDPTS